MLLGMLHIKETGISSGVRAFGSYAPLPFFLLQTADVNCTPLLFITSTPKLVAPPGTTTVLGSFYLLIFYFEKFSTSICRLP